MGTKFEDIEKGSAKKLTGIGVVVFLHVLVGLVLMAGLAKKITKPSEQPVELMIIQEIKPPEPPKEKPPEPPKIVEKVAQQPDPKPVEKVVPVQKPVTTPTVATPTPTVVASPSPSPVASPAPMVAAADPGPAQKPAGISRGVSEGEVGCKRPDYPRDALQKEESGEVTISVHVGANGQVIEAKVKRSSGSRSLDRAASKAFSLCTFKPAMKDGEPQQSWYDIPYEFVLS